jgi:hypothetical protein
MKSNAERKVDFEDVHNQKRDNRTRDRVWNQEELQGHRDGVAAIMEASAGIELVSREDGKVGGLEQHPTLLKLMRHHAARKGPYSKGFAGALASVLNEGE